MSQQTFKENDVGDTLTAQLKDEDGPIDLSGASEVRIIMRQADGQKTLDAQMSLTNATNGEVEYQWSSGDPIETKGVYEAEFKIIDGLGETETVPNNGYVSIKIEEELN